jgi:hypothetical protein
MTNWNLTTGEQMTPEECAGQHDFLPYLRSITDELTAIRDRVRVLVPHWLTDGRFKEAILRQLLRRHLPETAMVGSGFVVNYFGPSTEADIIVIDRGMPTLFKDDGLLIVTPESVKAVIEVKTRLNGPSELREAAIKLAAQKAHVQRHVQCNDVWAGLFVYEGGNDRHEDILTALGEARATHQCCIDSVAYGADTFVKFFGIPEDQGGPAPSRAWHSFHDPNLAAADFVASLIEFLVPRGKDIGSFAWFARRGAITKRCYLESKPGASPAPFAHSRQSAKSALE